MASSHLKASTALRRQITMAHHLQVNTAPRPHLKVMLLPQGRTNNLLQASMAHHHPKDSTEHRRQVSMELLHLHKANMEHPSQVVMAAHQPNRLLATVSKQLTSI